MCIATPTAVSGDLAVDTVDQASVESVPASDPPGWIHIRIEGSRPAPGAGAATAASRLPDYPETLAGGLQHVAMLAERYAYYAFTTRTAINAAADAGDAGTADLFTEISRGVDKHLWFLEAHLEAGYCN